MSNNLLFANIGRFLALIFLQVLVFKQILIANVLVYPVFIMLLPVELPTALVITASFCMGLAVDNFYSSPGIHAGASVFSAFMRYYLLGIMEPKGGYPNNSGPTQSKLGFTWFGRYSALFILVHLFIYFSIEAFSFVFILSILMRTVASFILSMIFIIIYQFLLDPKE